MPGAGKPPTAYFAFVAEVRARGLLSGPGQARQAAALWAQLPADERQRRSEVQRRLAAEWRAEHGAPARPAREQPLDGQPAFRLFCAAAREGYRKRIGAELPYTLRVRAELVRQFAGAREALAAVGEVAEAEHDFLAWAE